MGEDQPVASIDDRRRDRAHVVDAREGVYVLDAVPGTRHDEAHVMATVRRRSEKGLVERSNPARRGVIGIRQMHRRHGFHSAEPFEMRRAAASTNSTMR